MIHREWITPESAVLAGMGIALEDVAPGQGKLPVGDVNELAETDHRGEVVVRANQPIRIMLETLPQIQSTECSCREFIQTAVIGG